MEWGTGSFMLKGVIRVRTAGANAITLGSSLRRGHLFPWRAEDC
jgi:hypothetical protein